MTANGAYYAAITTIGIVFRKFESFYYSRRVCFGGGKAGNRTIRLNDR